MRVNLFFILFFFLAGVSSGQKFNAGLLAGLCISQVDGDHLAGFNKAGLTAGGFVNRKISEKMNLQFEIEFIQKGSRMPLNKDGFYFLMRLNYIEVPLLISHSVGKKWNLEAGGSFATLVSAHEEDQSGEITNAPAWHKVDYLVCVGANYMLSEHLILNLRYRYSVATIRPKNENYNYFYSYKGQFNKLFSFSLAYRF